MCASMHELSSRWRVPSSMRIGPHIGIPMPRALWPHRWPAHLHAEIVKVLVFNRARRIVGLSLSLDWRSS